MGFLSHLFGPSFIIDTTNKQKYMSDQPAQNQPQNNQNPDQPEQDPNALTEQDKQVYNQILSSINRMNSRVKQTKSKVENKAEEQKQASKRAEVQQIAQKLIDSKEKSEIVTKEDLLKDVQNTFEEVVVEVFSENKQLKKKIESLVAIIKEQNKKINESISKEEQLKQENEKLREDLVRAQDERLMAGRTNQKPQNITQKTHNNRSRALQDNQSEDYDFWSMPQNESSAKKRQNFVADSGLWVNDKDIDKSVFITDNSTKRK